MSAWAWGRANGTLPSCTAHLLIWPPPCLHISCRWSRRPSSAPQSHITGLQSPLRSPPSHLPLSPLSPPTPSSTPFFCLSPTLSPTPPHTALSSACLPVTPALHPGLRRLLRRPVSAWLRSWRMKRHVTYVM